MQKLVAFDKAINQPFFPYSLPSSLGINEPFPNVVKHAQLNAAFLLLNLTQTSRCHTVDQLSNRC
jgi:hypothetical protein